LALLRKVNFGQFVTSAEKEAFLSECPAKWHAMFHTSLSLHHLHACFKIYDNISLEALRQRMECSEDECFKCAGIPRCNLSALIDVQTLWTATKRMPEAPVP
jgi:hypothetical protein